MAYVKLPFLGPQAAVPSAPGGVVQAPAANYSGVSGAAAQLARAGQQSDIPTQPFMAPGEGMQQIGGAFTQVAGMLGQLAADRREAETDYTVAEKQSGLDMKYAQFLRDSETLDPTEREARWGEVSNEAINEMLGDEKLSPQARERLKVFGEKWRGDTSVRVAVRATQEIGERAENALFANIDSHRANGDFDAADAGVAHIRNEVAAGRMRYVDPQRLANEEERNRAGRVAAAAEERQNTYIESVRSQGVEAAEEMLEDPSIDATERERLRNIGRSVYADQVTTDAESMIAAIEDGTLTVPGEVDQWQPNNPRITPRMRREARETIMRRNDAAARQYTADNAPEIASKLRSEVANFDFEKDGEEEYYRLRMRIAELPAPIQGEVSRGLEMKFPGRSSSDETPPEVKDLIEKSLHSMLTAGAFGAFTHKKEALVDEQGKQKVSENGEPRFRHEFNSRDYQRALMAKAVAGGKWRRWADLNPKDAADPDKAQQKLFELVPEASRAGLFDMFDSAPDAPETTDAPVAPPISDGRRDRNGVPEPDLPSNPGPASNLILPPYQ